MSHYFCILKTTKEGEKMNWMRKLGLHYETMKSLYPNDKLMIVFDIDGTIIDMRYMVLHALKMFDKKNNSGFFEKLILKDINVDENTVGRLLINMKIPLDTRKAFLSWYEEYKKIRESILKSHKPFKGVMNVIQWFYQRSNTYIGLNTGRPESIRKTTLDLLNNIGADYNIRFKNDLLFMNPYDWNTDCVDIKAKGIKRFQDNGFRVCAFIDNEPENLLSISKLDRKDEILLLHADTIFKSCESLLPQKTVRGKKYNTEHFLNS